MVPAARACEIAELAEAVADEHCPAGRVEPQTIARAKGITLSFGAYGEAFDGMLEHRCRRFHIYCNLDRAGERDSPRARFTLAHELGHYYIDEHRNALAAGRVAAHGSQCEYESPILAEQEADLFAASLLMPAARFAARAKATTPGLEGILRLAGAFGTSLTSTAIRYAACDAMPCAVVKWDWRGCAWKCLSSATFQARFGRTVEAPEALAPGSPTARALAREAPPACGYFEAGTTAAAWFPRIRPGELRDVIFVEQAIGLGRYGVLSFLRPESGRYPFG
jgi:hypothetical protein